MRPENAVAALLEGAQRIIKGKREFLELLVTSALAGGHVLIEDNPGLKITFFIFSPRLLVLSGL